MHRCRDSILRKRKVSGERDVVRERGKKIFLERSAAKTLITIHRHTGKSNEEHAAAKALLDLTLDVEPVTHAEEREQTDEFPEPSTAVQLDQTFPEPVEFHVNRSTQTDKKILKQCSTQFSNKPWNIFYQRIYFQECISYSTFIFHFERITFFSIRLRAGTY